MRDREQPGAGGSESDGAGLARAWWRDRSSLHGLRDSVAAVSAFAAERGPFDGLLGFSQGACMAAALCALQEAEARGARPLPPHTPSAGGRGVRVTHCAPTAGGGAGEKTGLPALGFSVRFALFVSGFAPTGESAAAAAFRGAVATPATSLPTLHVLGRADEVIVPERCRALAQACADAEVVEHEGAHHVPSSRAVRDAVRAFLAARRGLA